MIKTWKLIKDGWTFVHPNTRKALIGHLYNTEINEYGIRASIVNAIEKETEWKYVQQEVRNVLKYLYDKEYKEVISKYQSWLKVDYKKHSLHNWYMPDSFI